MSDTTEVVEKFVGVLTEKESKEIAAFLAEELRLCRLERSGEEEEWKTIRRQRWARPEFEKKNVPWPDASNVCPPGAMIATNTVFGMTKNAFGMKKPFWSITALQEKNHDDLKMAKTIERYLQLLADSSFDLNKKEKDREIQEESDSLGTSFVTVAFTDERYKVTLDDGSQADAVFHSGPEWIVFPREDAYYRMRVKDIRKARWFARAIELEEHEVEERFASGKWTEWTDWRDDARTEAKEHEADADAMSKGEPQTRQVWDFFEVFIRWDLEPKDGFWEDLVLIFHEKSGNIVSAQLNRMGIRLTRQMNFIRRSFRLDGVGVGHAGMHMQAELEALHNNRINAVHMTTLKMFKGRKNSGIKEKEKMYPGKIWLLDNLADFESIEVGEVYPSSLQAEGNAWQYLQKATLMSDSMAGFADQTLKSRDGLGMQTNRMRANSGIVGSILEGMEDAYSDLGMMTVFQLVWNKETVMERERTLGRLTEDELSDLDKALSIDVHDIPAKLRFSVRTSDAEQTFEARRQNVLSLWSIYSVWMNKQIPLMMQAYTGIPQKDGSMVPLPQPVKEFILRTSVGSSILMEKIFEFFGEDETGDFVPPTKLEEFAFELMDRAQETMLRRMKQNATGETGGGPQAGGASPESGGLAGLIGAPGMAGGAGAPGGNPGAGVPNPQAGERAAAPFPGAGGFTSL